MDFHTFFMVYYILVTFFHQLVFAWHPNCHVLCAGVSLLPMLKILVAFYIVLVISLRLVYTAYISCSKLHYKWVKQWFLYLILWFIIFFIHIFHTSLLLRGIQIAMCYALGYPYYPC